MLKLKKQSRSILIGAAILLVMPIGAGIVMGGNEPRVYINAPYGTEVELIVQEVTPDGITFILKNSTNRQYLYGFFYGLFVRTEQQRWVQTSFAADRVPEMGLFLFASSETEPIELDWDTIDGLPSGGYKFIIDIRPIYWRSPTNSQRPEYSDYRNDYRFEVVFTLP